MPHAKIGERQRARAKQLRQTMTRAETLLWRYLKAHHLDELGIRRQVPMGKFIADFICHSARLIVEIDGATHDFQAQQRKDLERDAWFNSQGYVVLRVSNGDVLQNLAGVVATIRATAAPRVPIPPSLTLPHRGGGNRPARAARIAHTRGGPQP